jgi:predicted amidophosphoribosyltransferase
MKNLTTRKFYGIRQKHVNAEAWHIYGYKFFENQKSLDILNSYAAEDLFSHTFDVIVPIKPRDSGSDLVLQLASHISGLYGWRLMDILKSGNRSTNSKSKLSGLTVLIIDDVLYTGRTCKAAYTAIKKLAPKSIAYYAIARSTTR